MSDFGDEKIAYMGGGAVRVPPILSAREAPQAVADQESELPEGGAPLPPPGPLSASKSTETTAQVPRERSPTRQTPYFVKERGSGSSKKAQPGALVLDGWNGQNIDKKPSTNPDTAHAIRKGPYSSSDSRGSKQSSIGLIQQSTYKQPKTQERPIHIEQLDSSEAGTDRGN